MADRCVKHYQCPVTSNKSSETFFLSFTATLFVVLLPGNAFHMLNVCVSVCVLIRLIPYSI